MTGEGVARATASSPRSQPNEDSSCQVIRVKESGVETPNNSSRARWLRGSFRADWPLDGLGGGAGNVGRGIAQGEEPPRRVFVSTADSTRDHPARSRWQRGRGYTDP